MNSSVPKKHTITRIQKRQNFCLETPPFQLQLSRHNQREEEVNSVFALRKILKKVFIVEEIIY